jgi:hypothetical protein
MKGHTMRVDKIFHALGQTTDGVTHANCEDLILSGIEKIKSGSGIENLDTLGDIYSRDYTLANANNELQEDAERKRSNNVRGDNVEAVLGIQDERNPLMRDLRKKQEAQEEFDAKARRARGLS